MKKPIGFTNKLAIVLVIILIVGLIGGFYLAILSINNNYNGALYCWTIVFTPIGTAIGLVIGKVVDKNRDQNTDENGKGIDYAIAEAQNFYQQNNEDGDEP
jgi:H+/Cl- antiporter ClcA